MKIVFLDFDGVINSLIWYKNHYNEWEIKYLANEQAIQWVSEFCEKYDYKIVISSTWRYDGLEDCIKYLKGYGLRDNIDIIDITPVLHGKQRGDEITEWLNNHPEVERYLIFDDDSDMTVHMDKLIKSHSHVGFTYKEYKMAEDIEVAIVIG